MLFLDYKTVNVVAGSNMYTTEYKCMIVLELNRYEEDISSIQDLSIQYTTSGDKKYFVLQSSNSFAGQTNNDYQYRDHNYCQILPSGVVISSTGDDSPLTGTWHIFRLPESP